MDAPPCLCNPPSRLAVPHCPQPSRLWVVGAAVHSLAIANFYIACDTAPARHNFIRCDLDILSGILNLVQLAHSLLAVVQIDLIIHVLYICILVSPQVTFPVLFFSFGSLWDLFWTPLLILVPRPSLLITIVSRFVCEERSNNGSIVSILGLPLPSRHQKTTLRGA